MQIGVFLKDKSALFTGGGVFNTYLMSRINTIQHQKLLFQVKIQSILRKL